MDMILAVVIFVAQLICSTVVKHKIWKFAPTLLVAGLMSLTVLNASLGQLEPKLLVLETMMLLSGALAAGLHMVISIIWRRMKDRK